LGSKDNYTFFKIKDNNDLLPPPQDRHLSIQPEPLRVRDGAALVFDTDRYGSYQNYLESSLKDNGPNAVGFILSNGSHIFYTFEKRTSTSTSAPPVRQNRTAETSTFESGFFFLGDNLNAQIIADASQNSQTPPVSSLTNRQRCVGRLDFFLMMLMVI